MYMCAYRYSVTANAGQGHLVLGKVSQPTQLSNAEVTAVHQLCPSATLEGALTYIYNRVLVSGVVYTNLSYRQSSTNDYTLLLKDGTIAKAVKYLSFCSSSCKTPDTHLVLVYPHKLLYSSTGCRHIHHISDSVR